MTDTSSTHTSGAVASTLKRKPRSRVAKSTLSPLFTQSEDSASGPGDSPGFKPDSPDGYTKPGQPPRSVADLLGNLYQILLVFTTVEEREPEPNGDPDFWTALQTEVERFKSQGAGD